MSQEEGGLGIKNIVRFNEALIQELIWQVISEKERVWVQVIEAKYCPGGLCGPAMPLEIQVSCEKQCW